MKKKSKLKAKGKRFYRNTHGQVFRVESSHKLLKKILLKKRQRRIATLN